MMHLIHLGATEYRVHNAAAVKQHRVCLHCHVLHICMKQSGEEQHILNSK